MRIGFDAKRAAANFSGLGNYSRSLILNLQQTFPENTYFLYTPVFKKKAQTEALFSMPGSVLRMPEGIGTRFKSIWRSFGINREIYTDKLEVFHGLSGELPFIKNGGTKYILSVHDLIFLRFPAFYKAIDRTIYRFKLNFAAVHADKIIAISEQTKQDLIFFLNIEPSKIEVIYQSCGAGFRRTYTQSDLILTRKNYKLPKKYLLCVATLEHRKNQLLILKSLAYLKETAQHDQNEKQGQIENHDQIEDQGIHLVLIGRKTAYFKLLDEFIKEHGLAGNVHFLHDIPDSDLPLIYQNAHLFVYPSRFEGFGIPIIEALFSGVPVISSKGSCFNEAGGPNSLYIDPDDYQSLAEAIRELNSNEEKRTEMISRGRIFAQKFLPEILSRQLMNVYQHAST